VTRHTAAMDFTTERRVAGIVEKLR